MNAGNLVPPAPGVADIQAYMPGAAAAPGVADPIRLASNEAALGPSPLAVEAAVRIATGIDRYPDPTCLPLREAIAARYNLNPHRILCGAGSEALIHMIARAYLAPGCDFVVPQRAFTLGKIAALGCGATVISVPEDQALRPEVDALLAAITPNTRMVYLPNPNNPTGTLLSGSEISRLRAGLRDDILLVLDAAYRDYVMEPGYDAGDGLVGDLTGNVIVTSTFSKSYALAGLRIGWLHGSQDLVQTINLVRPVFGVGALSQAAAIAALQDRVHLDAEIALVTAQRRRLTTELVSLGLSVCPSHGNFILATLPTEFGKGSEVNQFLAGRGILVRPVANYDLPQSVRITIGTEAQMDAVTVAFSEWAATRS